MFMLFGALAMVVAAVGLYSIVAFAVSQRTHEVGIRMALGAKPAAVARLVAGDGLRATILGIGLGIGLAAIGARWFGSLLFQVSTYDPLVFAAVGATMIGVAVLASAIPALRATQVEPSTALRAD